jgi:uncharacterized Zn finger protein
MPILKINEALIRENATAQSFERGQQYSQSQAVDDLVWRDPFLQASVAGNDYYRVTIGFKNQKVDSAICSCPYDFGGWCKHIVAVLLQAKQAKNIKERPSLNQMLEQLDLERTKKLVHSLVSEFPDIIAAIDVQVGILTAPKSTRSKSLSKSEKSKAAQTKTVHPEIDRSPFRRQVRYLLREALHGDDYNYYEEDPFSEILDQEIEKAKKFIEAGDSFRAFVMLYAVAEELCDYTEEIENYCGDMSDLVYGLDEAIAEASLWTDFTIEDRQKWITEIEGTQDILGADFDISLAAITQGWDAPHVQAALRGEYNDDLTEEQIEILSNDPDDLGYLRLRILATQERFDEYLNFAKAYSFPTLYTRMLIQLGRLDDAIAAAEDVNTERDALEIAKQLVEQGAEKEALNVAYKGLQLHKAENKHYSSVELAVLTATLAERFGEQEILLEAKLISFKAIPSLADYHIIRDLTKAQWKSVKPDLIKHLSTISEYAPSDAKVDIFLEEEMFDEAIAIANNNHCSNYIRLRVMKAVVKINPKWVVAKSQALAEEIIDRGNAKAYEDAIAWLEQMRNGYLAMKNEKDWLSYRSQLVTTHGKKRKLMELLNRKGL